MLSLTRLQATIFYFVCLPRIAIGFASKHHYQRRVKFHPHSLNEDGDDGLGNVNTWRSGIRFPGADRESALASIQELCESTPYRRPTHVQSGLAFLFVSQRFTDIFSDLVEKTHESLGEDVGMLCCLPSLVVV